ncbi:hypothetical protein Tco_1208894 [Tanacetum coccineum]
METKTKPEYKKDKVVAVTSFESYLTSLSNSAPDGVFIMELAKGSILNEETRRKSQGSSSQSDVLVIERRGRGQARVTERTSRKTTTTRNKHKNDDDGDDNTDVNTTTDEFFVCYDYDMINLANDDSSWILDSGTTCHVAT